MTLGGLPVAYDPAVVSRGMEAGAHFPDITPAHLRYVAVTNATLSCTWLATLGAWGKHGLMSCPTLWTCVLSILLFLL